MSDTSSSDAKKPMEQPNSDISEAMGQRSVTSNETSTTPKNLSDMPIYVVGLIIGRSGYKEQLKLRKVCKSLRALVDKQKPALVRLQFVCFPSSIHCLYNCDLVTYYSSHRNRTKACENSPGYPVVDCDNYEKIAYDDIAFTLKNPKLQLDNFSFYFDIVSNSDEDGYYSSSFYKKRRDIFESIGHQLSARSCNIEIDGPDEYCSILPYFKPGVLEKINVSCLIHADFSGDVDSLKKVVLLDQWKQAKELYLMCRYNETLMEYAKHFKGFRFCGNEVEFNLLMRIRKFLSSLNSFEYCLVEHGDWIDAEDLHSETGRPAAPNERTEYVSHCSIPDSDDYLEFMFFEKSVEIRKIKKS